jgi:protein-disulfide isomerase
MALKDRLNDALNDTPSDNARRLETLHEVLGASGGGSDAEVQAALTAIITEREQKAATFSAAGQTEMAKSERFEIDALRGFLRYAEPDPKAPAAKPKPAAAAPKQDAGPAKPLVSRTQIIISVAAAALLVAALAVYKFGFSEGPSEDQLLANGTTAAITVFKDDRTKGNPKAPITMLEYAAPTCPHCAHFSLNVMPQIEQNYIDTGKVFYIFRTFPLSATDGAVEAIARRCLPADKYFQFIDLMFRNQSKWDPDGYQIPDVHGALIQMARVMGITPEQADQCMTNKEEQDRINQVALDGETKYNIQGTPTFIINGSVVQAGEADWPQLKARFDSLLSKH